MRFSSSYLFPIWLANFLAIARWLSACHMHILGISGDPLMRARGDSSSTTPGSAMKLLHPGMSCAMEYAMMHPKSQACLCPACLTSSSICWLISYTPPATGFASPPLPITASKAMGMSIRLSSSMTSFRLMGSWSVMSLKLAISSAVWVTDLSMTGLSSS